MKNTMSQSENRKEKILWVNPSFLDYRIPLYGELNKLSSGNFHLIYSKERIPKRCDDKVREVLGENAHPLEKEKHLKFGDTSSDFANSSLNIPIPSGLYRMIKDVRPDAILAEGFFQFTPWALVYSFIHKIPLYIAYERTAHTERNCPVWRRIYRKFIGKFVTGYLANGSLTKEYLISQGVKPEQIQTGGMCADSKGLADAVKALNSKEIVAFKKKIVGEAFCGLSYALVGRMIARKGVAYALDGWMEHIKMYPDDKLILIGDGPLLDEYKTEYTHKSIIFAGGIDYREIYKYYAIADVFFIATLEDNWSLVVPEAMACGLPIACSIYNGCHPELVHFGENGITFDPLNLQSVVNAFRYFHSIDLKTFGNKSIELEEKFNPENVALNAMSLLGIKI